MKIKRHGAALAFLAAGALVLSACGTDDNTAGDDSGDSGTAANGAAADVECGGKETLKASGSSAQANAMTRFVAAYEATCDPATLNYTSNGSGDGVSQFIGGQTDFGGTDSPLDPDNGEVDDAKERCDGNDAWNLPVVFGPIAMAYNVDGADGLVLDGSTVAGIFSGEITSWDDPAIAELNDGVSLPAEDIVVIFRSDESGTTDNFQKYLETASGGAWTQGAGKTFNGGVGEGANGNEGVSAAVAETPNSITYTEWSYATQNDLQVAEIINSGGGEPVELSVESAGIAIDNVELSGQGNDMVLNLDSLYGTEADGGYPLVLATYEVVCSKYADSEVATAVKAFLTVAVTSGQDGLEDNGYIPVPEEFRGKLETAIDAIA